MTTFFQSHLGDEGVYSDHRNLKTTRPPRQLSGTPGTWLVKAPDNSILEFSLHVFLSTCGFFHLCLYLAFVCLFVGWLVGLDSLIQRLVVAVLPSVGSGCQGTECLPCPPSAPLASRQVGGAGWRFCWPSSQNTKFQWAPGKQGEEHLEAGVRQKSTNLSSSPQGRGKCLSQRCPLRVKRLRLVKISETGNTLLSLPVNTSF